MYYQQALNQIISKDLVPNLTRLKYEVDETIKRSIFDDDDYDAYEKYLGRYITAKHNPELDKKDLVVRKYSTGS